MSPLQSLLYATLALTSTVFAAVNGPCSIDGTPGVCIPSADCTESGGSNRVGFCPDDTSDIKCCTKPSCGSGGNCGWSASCTETAQSGLCPGPADFKCCTGGSSSPGGASSPPSRGTRPQAISPHGVAFIAEFEGFYGNFYQDEANVKTIGYGHACQPSSACDNIKAPLTKAQAQDLLQSDLKEYVQCVNRYVKVPLNQNQLDALTSFTYNLGCGMLQNIATNLNQNDYQGATARMLKYNKVVGVGELAGLTKRRKAEVAMFNS